MRLAQHDPRQVDMLMTLTLGCGNIAIFIMSVLTGLRFSTEESAVGTADVYGSMFDVFRYATYLILLLLVIKMFAPKERESDK